MGWSRPPRAGVGASALLKARRGHHGVPLSNNIRRQGRALSYVRDAGVGGLLWHFIRAGSRYNWIMWLCDKCIRARAFIKRSKAMDAAVKAVKVVVVTCMLCGATIGPSASSAFAEARSPARAEYAEFAAMWEWGPPSQAFLAALGFSSADRGDSEPPHPAELDQTLPGSAATYSGTASAAGVINGLPQLSTLPYSGGAVPTSLVTGVVPRNWAPLAMGREYTPVLGMPEHARLEQFPPVIHMPAKYAAVPAISRGDRRDRGYRRGCLPASHRKAGPARCPDGSQATQSHLPGRSLLLPRAPSWCPKCHGWGDRGTPR